MHGRRSAPVALQGVTLLATGRCNLRCAYCYQASRRAADSRMPWRVARSAVDLLLASPGRPVALDLSGGEPLLEPALVRRLIDYARMREPDPERFEIDVTTNGTRLTPAIVAHFAERNVVLRLSFDGVREAQEMRGDRTFAGLDRVVDTVRALQPAYFRTRVEVVMTVTASSVPHLVASVRYFIAKGVTRIRVAPCIVPDPKWRYGTRQQLREQFDDVVSASVDLWRAERRCPVSFLEGAPTHRAARSQRHLVCGAASGRSFCVDWRGGCWPCSALARPITAMRLPRGGDSRAFDLGHLESEQLPEHLVGLAAAAQRVPAFAAKQEMRSAYGRCGDCEHFAECLICPAAILHGQAEGANCRVPDLLCAFNQVALAARRKFHDRLALGGDAEAHHGGAPGVRDIGALLRDAVRFGGRQPLLD